MIYLESNQSTLVAIELAQVVPSNFNFYLFEFIWEEVPQQDPRYFYTPTLVNSTRFSLFNIVEADQPVGAVTTYTAGPIDLNPGQYKYNIYAGTAPPNPSNLSPFLNTDPIHTGRMVVKEPIGLYPGPVLATLPSVYA